MQAGKGLRAPKLCRWNFAEPGIREQHEGVLWLLCGHLSLSKFFRDRARPDLGQLRVGRERGGLAAARPPVCDDDPCASDRARRAGSGASNGVRAGSARRALLDEAIFSGRSSLVVAAALFAGVFPIRMPRLRKNGLG